jgi:uncharacterized protein
MNQLPQGLRYLPTVLVATTWSLAGAMIASFLIPYLAVQTDNLANPAIVVVSSPGFAILCGMLTGILSLFFWHRSVNRLVPLLLVTIIPIFLSFVAFVFSIADTQGVRPYIFQAAQSGNLKNTREQLLIQSQTVSQTKKLIQLGTNVNARDPKGHSALYSASWEGRDPEILKLLLASGAKPDAAALRHAITWGRLDAIQLMFNATSDDGRALIAELGSDALQANNVHTRTSEADRAKITQLLIARGAKPIKN